MPDPETQTPTEYRYYVARNGIHSDYSKRTQEQLVGDVNVLHKFTKNLVREKDQLDKRLRATQRRLEMAGWKLWTLGLVVTGEGAVIGWLVKFVLGHLR